MPGPSALALFALASITLLVIPGPAVLYIVTRSVDEGRVAGLASVAGVHVGTSIHVAAAALGLSALLVASSTAFTIVKLAGAAYLIVIGLRRLLSRAPVTSDASARPPVPLRRVIAQGAVVNLLNPKTALFFLAFLPQFVDQGAGHIGLQVLALGGFFMLLGVVSDSTYALVGSAARDWLRRRVLDSRRQRYVTGGVYVALGASAALAGSARHS